MSRNRFVEPGHVRLELADVHTRAHADLLSKGVERRNNTAKPSEDGTEPEKVYRKATSEEIADSQARVDAAVEDADWIEIKRELTAGESRKSFSKLIKEMHFGERAQVDPEQVGLAKVVAYLLDWSLAGDAGEKVPYSVDALLNVDVVTYGEIEAAIDWHEEQVAKERASRKNVRAGGQRSSTTSPSAG